MLIVNLSFAQNHPLKRLNDYKFVYILPLSYEGGREDIYGITKMIKNRLEKSGLLTIVGVAPIKSNPSIENCEILTCDVTHNDLNTSYLLKKDSVVIRFIDCNDNVVYQLIGPTKGLNSKPESNYQDATFTALKQFEGFYYRNVRGETYMSKVDKTKTMMAVFPGGLKKLDELILANLQYPKTAKKDRIAGTVDLSFWIDNRGFVKDVKISKGVREDLDNEAKRIIENLPRWIAAQENGVSRMIYSVTFATKQRPNSEKVDY
jgi:TonB family protein